ncbi:MAG: RimK family alpha-L-glutamate ligase [Gammaproteobacteria bacterium]
MIKGTDKIIVGSEEWVSLPQLSIPAIKARIDSGAKTSALHAFNIRGFKRNGMPWVSYELHPVQHNRRVIVRCESEVLDRRTVKNTSGVSEKRYVIRSLLQLSGQQWEIEVTLANRDSMGYRMLLGREAMKERILVDPSAKLLCGNISKEAVHKHYDSAPSQLNGLKIGLLASNPDLYSNQRLLEAGEERGHDIRFYDIKHCYMKLDAETPEVYYRGGRLLNDLDAVIPRVRPNLTFYGCALVRQFESIGVYSLNSARAISSARDKLYCLQVLLQNGLRIPTSGFANSPIDTQELIDMVNGAPLVVKLLQESQDQGGVLAETTKAAESVISAFKSIDVNLLVQEFIREANGETLRLFVVDGKVVSAIQQKTSVGELRSGAPHRRVTGLARVSSQEKSLAVRAAKVLELKVAGVDIVRSDEGPLLLEVTTSPGFEGIENTTGKDIAGTMIAAIEKKLRWVRPIANSAENLSA